MRTKQQILEEYTGGTLSPTVYRNTYGRPLTDEVRDEVTLEVLLDIRDTITDLHKFMSHDF